MEKDDEVKGVGHSYDFGARVYDPRIAKWLSVDAYTDKYPNVSPYNFALNTPIIAVDPDGNLVLFINGLRFYEGAADQGSLASGGYLIDAKSLIYDENNAGALRSYWNNDGKPNTMGNIVDMATRFKDRIGDQNDYYLSGSSHWTSGGEQRMREGANKAEMFHAMVQAGKIKLEDGESIKIVSHSQGGAHSAGFARRLMEYTDEETGKPLYNIEVMYYVTPHQPTEINHPEGIRGVQYSHPSDYVSSESPWWMTNGGTEFGPIDNITAFDKTDILGDDAFYNSSDRAGHNVQDNGYIFNFPQSSQYSVAPRQDSEEQRYTR